MHNLLKPGTKVNCIIGKNLVKGFYIRGNDGDDMGKLNYLVSSTIDNSSLDEEFVHHDEVFEIEDELINYNKRAFRSKEIYFVDHRIKIEKRDKDLYYYECRGKDDDIFVPCTIENAVGCNFAGTVISKESLEFDKPVDTPYGIREYILLTDEESEDLISGYTDFDDEEEEN